MGKMKFIWPAFILVALVQLYVPVKMILNREAVLNKGTGYKFKTAPVDPYDPFRGKYIVLNYDETDFTVSNEKEWNSGETVYVLFGTDGNGFARIRSVLHQKPASTRDYLEATVSYVTSDGTNKLTLEYPFDRFYMDEAKAGNAELSYRDAQRDSLKTTYALVNIMNGDAVLKDVLINGISIGNYPAPPSR